MSRAKRRGPSPLPERRPRIDRRASCGQRWQGPGGLYHGIEPVAQLWHVCRGHVREGDDGRCVCPCGAVREVGT